MFPLEELFGLLEAEVKSFLTVDIHTSHRFSLLVWNKWHYGSRISLPGLHISLYLLLILYVHIYLLSPFVRWGTKRQITKSVRVHFCQKCPILLHFFSHMFSLKDATPLSAKNVLSPVKI